MKSFKNYLTENYPNFNLEENVLGALGSLALGALAVGKTAIDRSRGIKTNYYTQNSGDNEDYDNEDYDQKYKTKNLLNKFINQNWNWDKIINDGIIKFGYVYETGSEQLTDDDITPILKADRNLNQKASFKNKHTGKIVSTFLGKKWLLANAKNYWNDDRIRMFYKSLEITGRTPQDYGGEDIGV